MTSYSLNSKELERLEMCQILHQCPWWRRFFPKHKNKTKDFIVHHFNSSGIGKNVEIECTTCGKVYDITDYGCW